MASFFKGVAEVGGLGRRYATNALIFVGSPAFEGRSTIADSLREHRRLRENGSRLVEPLEWPNGAGEGPRMKR